MSPISARSAASRPRPRASPRSPPSAGVDREGVAAMLVLDVARVGSGLGVDLDLVAALRRAHPGSELLAGGGIGSVRDLERLADSGCDGALIATALHDGSLANEHIEAVRRRQSGLRDVADWAEVSSPFPSMAPRPTAPPG